MDTENILANNLSEIKLFYGKIDTRKVPLFNKSTNLNQPFWISEYGHVLQTTLLAKSKEEGISFKDILNKYSDDWIKLIPEDKKKWPLWPYYYQETQENERFSLKNIPNQVGRPKLQRHYERTFSYEQQLIDLIVKNSEKLGIQLAIKYPFIDTYILMDTMKPQDLHKTLFKKHLGEDPFYSTLLYIYRNRQRLTENIKFYDNSHKIDAPWKTNEFVWSHYMTRSEIMKRLNIETIDYNENPKQVFAYGHKEAIEMIYEKFPNTFKEKLLSFENDQVKKPYIMNFYNNSFLHALYDWNGKSVTEAIKQLSPKNAFEWFKHIPTEKKEWKLWETYKKMLQDNDKFSLSQVINKAEKNITIQTKKDEQRKAEEIATYGKVIGLSRLRSYEDEIQRTIIINGCKMGLEMGLTNNDVEIYFSLDSIDYQEVIEKKYDKITHHELRYLYRNRHKIGPNVKFFLKRQEVAAPWVTNPEIWNQYKPKSNTFSIIKNNAEINSNELNKTNLLKEHSNKSFNDPLLNLGHR